MIKFKLISVFTFVIITNANAQNEAIPAQQNIGNGNLNISNQQKLFVGFNTNNQQVVINNSNLNNNPAFLAQENEQPNPDIQNSAPQQIMYDNNNPGNQENEVNNYDQINDEVETNSNEVSQKKNSGQWEKIKFTKSPTSGNFSKSVSRGKKKLNYFCFRTSRKINSIFAKHKTKKSDYACFVW